MKLPQTDRLLALMARLRDPEKGCPWDVRQTYQSLAPFTLEETYEVIDAIERGDFEDLRHELGDLLLQVVFYARIAEEEQRFDFEDVAAAISDKLVRRHPHVFGDAVFANDAERHAAWEASKAEERQQKLSDQSFVSVLDGVTKGLPALLECEKIQDRAAHHGFDWPDVEPVFAKVEEELAEVHEAWRSGDARHIEEEIGDLLLVVVNLARHLKINPELALKASTRKFTRRFNHIERALQAQQRALSDCELAELDALWNEAKRVLSTRES